jgi:2-haloalkanoic acid dehalogenase type II
MRQTDFEVLSFDCYGTLIDWEKGILSALQPLLEKIPQPLTEDAVLEAYAEAESAQEIETPTMRYSKLLRIVYAKLARQWDTEVSEEECTAFGNSVPDWPVFDDSSDSLQYLKKHYKLVILSNVDHESFAGSHQKLGVEFDAIYTAEDIGSYKPDLQNFSYLISHLQTDLGIDKSHILHTAQSLFHDHVPATAMGLATAWIDRRHDKQGWGATKAPLTQAKIDFHFHSMADLVTAHRNDTGE